MFYYRIDFSLILSILSLKHKNRPSSNTLNSMITLDLILAIYLKLSVDVLFFLHFCCRSKIGSRETRLRCGKIDGN
jgi:hypothetical protein